MNTYRYVKGLTTFALSAVICFGAMITSPMVSATGLDDFNRAGVKQRSDGSVDDDQARARAGIGARPVGRAHIEHGALGHRRGGEGMERFSRAHRGEAIHRSNHVERPHFGSHR
jgi:hypothetical protein